jgi:hypothetical protein
MRRAYLAAVFLFIAAGYGRRRGSLRRGVGSFSTTIRRQRFLATSFITTFVFDFRQGQVALKRYRSHPMMLIGDEPQSYPSYRDIAASAVHHLPRR